MAEGTEIKLAEIDSSSDGVCIKMRKRNLRDGQIEAEKAQAEQSKSVTNHIFVNSALGNVPFALTQIMASNLLL